MSKPDEHVMDHRPMTDQPEREMLAEAFFEWRDHLRKKHRTMTIAEYHAWRCAGDVLSHPSLANAFPGGLTITLDPSSGYLGKLTQEAKS